MTEIASVHLETVLSLTPETPQLLIVESPQQFYNTVSVLNGQMAGEDGEFVFSEEGKEISPGKAGEIVTDLFNFDLNDKKIITLLYKKLEKNFNNGELIVKFNELNSFAVNFLEDLFFDVPFSLSYEEVGVTDYLKFYSVKIEKNYENFLEKIICYINILVELKCCRFVIFVNLKSFLSDGDLLMLYSHCLKEKVSLLLIESSVLRPVLPEEKAVIITEDLCEILVNYDQM